jgi:hypothetical protein
VNLQNNPRGAALNGIAFDASWMMNIITHDSATNPDFDRSPA